MNKKKRNPIYYSAGYTDKQLNRTGVYVIIHKDSGKRYIGSTKSKFGFISRWRRQFTTLNRNIGDCPRLQEAWNIYGSDAFEFRILEFADPKYCRQREDWWIQLFGTTDLSYGFNVILNIPNSSPYQYKTDKRFSVSGSFKCFHLYTLTAPDGVIHQTRNLKLFAKENGLNDSILYQVLKGKFYQHKGWHSITKQKVR